MPKTLTVLTDPNPLLRQRAAPIDTETLARLQREGVFDALMETMRAGDGVGIAATQVGIPYRMFVAREGQRTRIYINPEITSRSFETEVDTEGCLSVPGKVGLVERARSVSLRALDANGGTVTRKARGLVARIYQHEIDHLDGILFIDRASRIADVSHDTRAPRV